MIVRISHLDAFDANIVHISPEIDFLEEYAARKIRSLDARILKSHRIVPLLVRLAPKRLLHELFGFFE